MYEDVFAINEDSRKKEYKTYPLINEYYLNNYSFLKPKLDSEFYYTYFLRTCLFDIDIMELSDFFQFQLENCNNPEKLIELVKLRILPDIDKIISNAKITGTALEYRAEKKIKDSFVETEGRIVNRDNDFQVFYSLTATKELKEGHLQRKKTIKEIIKNSEMRNTNDNGPRLNWIGETSHLFYIISVLAQNGFIEHPLNKNGDENYSEFARQVLGTFKINKNENINTARLFLSPNTEQHQKTKSVFEKARTNIPHKKLLG